MDKKILDYLKMLAKEKGVKKVTYNANTLDLLQQIYELGQRNFECPLCGLESISSVKEQVEKPRKNNDKKPRKKIKICPSILKKHNITKSQLSNGLA